nr:VTT domain-containing protein [Lachnospiraceae bacterium]
VYGFVLSFAVTFTSFVIANMIVYFIAKKRIGRLDELVFSSEGKVQKLFEWINNENPAYMVMLAYMMPGMPNGFVPYVASKADVDAKQFFKVLVIGTAPQIFAMCFISGRLVRGDVALSVIVMILMFVMVVVLYVLKDRIISAKRRIREKTAGTNRN